jgi:TPR repeat protein
MISMISRSWSQCNKGDPARSSIRIDIVDTRDPGLMYWFGNGVPQNYVLAHMWLNLAASTSDSSVRRTATNNRDWVAANKMTSAQIAEAQRMASEWKPK